MIWRECWGVGVMEDKAICTEKPDVWVRWHKSLPLLYGGESSNYINREVGLALFNAGIPVFLDNRPYDPTTDTYLDGGE